MNAQTLEALKASIAKWERNAEAKTPNDFTISAGSCPLCDLFNLVERNHCTGCPVFERTGERFCKGTPYINAHSAAYSWCLEFNGAGDRAHAAARDEVAFLKSLLPVQPEALCSDCPPIGYPTDITRCSPCPRRSAEAEGRQP